MPCPQHRAVLSQHTNVVFPFTVAEIVRMGANPAKSSRSVDSAVTEIMAECDVTHLAEQSVTRLSGGEQQRVHLARTLLQLKTADDPSEPKLLLLDEPTASLDLSHQLRVLELVKRSPRPAPASWWSSMTSIWRRCSQRASP